MAHNSSENYHNSEKRWNYTNGKLSPCERGRERERESQWKLVYMHFNGRLSSYEFLLIAALPLPQTANLFRLPSCCSSRSPSLFPFLPSPSLPLSIARALPPTPLPALFSSRCSSLLYYLTMHFHFSHQQSAQNMQYLCKKKFKS